MSEKEYFSYTKVNTFENCPRKFEFVYKRKYPKSSNVHSLKGTLLHAMIEAYLSGDDFDIPYEGEFRSLPEDEFNKMKEEFENIKTQTLIQQLKKIYGQYEKLSMEDKVFKTFPDFSFNGSSDTFVKHKDRAIIIDYKTGKPREDFTQLKYYALIYSYIYPEINNFSLILSFVSYNDDRKIILEKKDLEEVENDLLFKINEILNTKSFNKKLSKLCDYCEYKNECMMKDQIDKVSSDIIESKGILPLDFKGPLIWDGYIGSKVSIINQYPSIKDLENNQILTSNSDEGIMLDNILEEYELNRKNFFILNHIYFLNKDNEIGESKYSSINDEQFKNLLRIPNNNYYIIFGEKTFEKITNLKNTFKHDTKIEWKSKTIYMFHHPYDILNNYDDEVTYNLFKEIKEIMS